LSILIFHRAKNEMKYLMKGAYLGDHLLEDSLENLTESFIQFFFCLLVVLGYGDDLFNEVGGIYLATHYYELYVGLMQSILKYMNMQEPKVNYFY